MFWQYLHLAPTEVVGESDTRYRQRQKFHHALITHSRGAFQIFRASCGVCESPAAPEVED